MRGLVTINLCGYDPDVAVLDLIVAPALTLDDLLGLELHLLDAVAARETAPALIIFASPGRIVSISRYHQYDGPPERAGIGVTRRLTGGRVVGAGEGWAGLALILPSRTALLKEDAARFKPDQIMNRYVRGILNAVRTLGLECFYPGRDAITFERRELGMCTLEINASGAMLFEATIALNRGMEELVHDLERVDPDGALSCGMYDATSATKLVRELHRDVRFEELATALASGYGALLGESKLRELSAIEIAQEQHRARSLAELNWLTGPRARQRFVLKNQIASQLGSIEAAIALAPDERIEAIQLSGDFIANSPAIEQLQNELRGRKLDLPSISQAVTKTFAGGDNFILGEGELSNLVKLIAGVN